MKKLLCLVVFIFSQFGYASSLVYDCKSLNDLYSGDLKFENLTLVFNLNSRNLAILSREDKNSGIREFSSYYNDTTEEPGSRSKYSFIKIGETGHKIEISLTSQSQNHQRSHQGKLFVYEYENLENANKISCHLRH